VTAGLRFKVDFGLRGAALVVRAMRGRRRVGHIILREVDLASEYNNATRYFREGPCAVVLEEASRALGRPLRVLTVDNTFLDDEERGRGSGVDLYAAAAIAAAALGAAIVPSQCVGGVGSTSSAALRVWRSKRLAQRVSVFGGTLAYGGE
jgi:predicted GNAT family acetyltransferase